MWSGSLSSSQNREPPPGFFAASYLNCWTPLDHQVWCGIWKLVQFVPTFCGWSYSRLSVRWGHHYCVAGSPPDLWCCHRFLFYPILLCCKVLEVWGTCILEWHCAEAVQSKNDDMLRNCIPAQFILMAIKGVTSGAEQVIMLEISKGL